MIIRISIAARAIAIGMIAALVIAGIVQAAEITIDGKIDDWKASEPLNLNINQTSNDPSLIINNVFSKIYNQNIYITYQMSSRPNYYASYFAFIDSDVDGTYDFVISFLPNTNRNPRYIHDIILCDVLRNVMTTNCNDFAYGNSKLDDVIELEIPLDRLPKKINNKYNILIKIYDNTNQKWAVITTSSSVLVSPTSIESTPTPITITASQTPTPAATASEPESSAVLLHGEKTDVELGEDILLKLSAVNLITKPPMTVQVMIYPPSGMSVTSSEFVKSGAGIYTTTYSLNRGDGRDIEVGIKTNQVGDFNVKGRIIYYFGDNQSTAEDHTLNLPIKVRKEGALAQNEESPAQKQTPGFGIIADIIAILFISLKKRG